MYFSHYYLGQSNVVRLLLQNGANVDAKNKDKWAAIHLAAENGSFPTQLFFINFLSISPIFSLKLYQKSIFILSLHIF